MTVRHRLGKYEIHFGSLSDGFKANECPFIVTDANVGAAWSRAFPQGAQVLEVPSGEGAKSLDHFGDLLEQLAIRGANRQSVLIAVGGGVVGDLAGYVAASYMRGVRYVQVPTTLLAQVDSSVGGKVGVNLPQGKNLVGAFYPPTRVHIALETLQTLPDRQFANGMAEVWKYAFIMDPSLMNLLGEGKMSANDSRLEAVVGRCIELKTQIVEADEFERTGQRAILNFGHTVGHALEQATGYGLLLHGEAVAIGMVAEARLGERLGISERGTAEQIATALSKEGLPIDSELLDRPELLLPSMRKDKKAVGGELAFALLSCIGQCKLVPGVSESDVREALTNR